MKRHPTHPKPGHKKSRARPAAAPRKNVAAHEYDEDNQALTVTFASGKRYRYTGVPKDVAAGFSGGSSLHRDIIGKYPHERLGD